MSTANAAKLKEQFDAGRETRADFTIDFAPLLARLAAEPAFAAGDVLERDRVITRLVGRRAGRR